MPRLNILRFANRQNDSGPVGVIAVPDGELGRGNNWEMERPNNAKDAKHAKQSSADIVEKELSYEIVGGFREVYYQLGYGLSEKFYARALEIELRHRGLRVEREYPVPVFFKGIQIGYERLDMIVERRVVVPKHLRVFRVLRVLRQFANDARMRRYTCL